MEKLFRLCVTSDRGKYIRNNHIFANFGENSTFAVRKVPLYPELIYIGNNVRIAAGVHLITHDMIHAMLNNGGFANGKPFQENIGCIKIDDNVFVGANTTILANVHIGSNVIIGAGSIVNKSLKGGYVYAGIPAKAICTFDEYLAKRKNEKRYPESFKRNGDSIDEKFSIWLWERFNNC